MRFAFTEQQLELRNAVRTVLARECTTADVRTPGVGAARRCSVLAELGSTALLVPERLGGVGLGFVDLIGILEEVGWAALPEPIVESAALAAPLLAAVEAGSAEGALAGVRVGHWLPRIASGDLAATVGGITLEARGPAPTTAEAVGAAPGTVRTAGVVGASRAGLFLLARVAGSGWEVHGVPVDEAWVTAAPALDPTRDLGAVEWTPSAASLLVDGARARGLVEETADRAAVALAAELVGLGDRMVAITADYARQRTQFGKPIGSFQAVKHHLAGARVKLEFARPAVYRAADSVDRALPARPHDASVAKSLGADAADLAAQVSLQVHGAMGYTAECDLQLFLKRAWALGAAWGDAPTHRARALEAAIGRLRGGEGG